MKMVDIIECLREMTYSPTKSNPIFPPSHSAHARPKHVKRCIRGPSVAPLNDRAWRTKGIWFVTSPRARKGAKSLGSLTDFCSDAAESTRIRFRGGGLDLISSVDEVVTAAIFAGGLCAEPIFAGGCTRASENFAGITVVTCLEDVDSCCAKAFNSNTHKHTCGILPESSTHTQYYSPYTSPLQEDMNSQSSQSVQSEALSPSSVFTPQTLVIASASFATLLLASSCHLQYCPNSELTLTKLL